MKRLINNGDIFDKYVSFEDKKFREDTIKQFNWLGHRHIAGTYSGSAYSTSFGENYMASNLRNDSNPKGSLLVAAKNYTDQKIAAIVGGGGGGGGSTAPARHGYSIFIYVNFHYEVYTTKDYGWQIGKYISITDFKSNNNYRELRYEGNYPASGIRYTNDGSEKEVISRFEIINSDNCYISGYDVAKESYFRHKLPENALNTVGVIKLY